MTEAINARKDTELRRIAKSAGRSLLSPVTLCVWVLVSVLATAAGPFGTFETMTLESRYVFWTGVAAISILFGTAIRALGVLLFGPGRPLLFDSFCVVGLTAGLTPVVWFMANIFRSTDDAHGKVDPVLLMVQVGLVVVAVFLIRRILPGLRSPDFPGAFTPYGDTGPPRLAARLSDAQARILRLTVRDHFVDVVTESGTETLRMRFADAVREMDPVEGFGTHRSHWVAHWAIAGIEREAGRLYLRLQNGDRVPVSRKYRTRLESAGVVKSTRNATA